MESNESPNDFEQVPKVELAAGALTADELIRFNLLSTISRTKITPDEKEELQALAEKKIIADEQEFKTLLKELYAHLEAIPKVNLEEAWKVLSQSSLDIDPSKLRDELDNPELLKERLLETQVRKAQLRLHFVPVLRRLALIDRIRNIASKAWISRSQASSEKRAEGEAMEKLKKLEIRWAEYKAIGDAFEVAWYDFVSAQQVLLEIAKLMAVEIQAGVREIEA